MKIVHGSDWHGLAQKLPEADLYVITGDMLDNYPVKDRDPGSFTYREYRIDPAHEREMQDRVLRDFVACGGFRQYLGTPDAPVVCVRGNHDFVDLAPMFAGCAVTEFRDNEVVEILGVKIAGHRGIPYIAGTWSDETDRATLLARVRAMPVADIYVTHYAPAGMLDAEGANAYGLKGMTEELTDRGRPFLHCFGHIHGAHGVRRVGDYMFSNAATTVNEIEWSP